MPTKLFINKYNWIGFLEVKIKYLYNNIENVMPIVCNKTDINMDHIDIPTQNITFFKLWYIKYELSR